MRKIDPEREIIREWEALHDSQRRTERHAAMFAMAIKDKCPFIYDGGRYQAIKAIIGEHQKKPRRLNKKASVMPRLDV
jgi:hypothetical protein